MKFPKMHIAESTVNRILNTWDGFVEMNPQVLETTAPQVPDPSFAEAELTKGIASIQPSGAATPEGAEVALGAATGASPMESMLGGLGESP